MNKKEYRFVFTNLLVVVFFLFTNPFIALLLCAILSSLNLKISYFIFTSSFIISWTLYHFMRDFVVSGGDVIPYIGIYHSSINESIITLISKFADAPVQNEPLWRIFNKFFSFFFGYSPSFYVFTIYLIIFQLVSILAYVIDKHKYVIIIYFMFLLNLGIMYNIFHVWRHTISVLIFLIGIYLNNNGNKPILSRLLMYMSPFIQLVTLPLIILYELFVFLNRSGKYKSSVSFYISLFLIGSITFDSYFYSIVDIFNLHQFYSIHTNPASFRLYWLISPLSLMLIFTLFKKRSQLSVNDFFVGTHYYLLVFTLLIIPSFPAIIWGRTFYLFLIGASIIVGKMFISNFKQITLIIIAVGCYRFYSLSNDNIALTFNYLGGGTPFNPTYGIISMIYHQEYFNMFDDNYLRL